MEKNHVDRVEDRNRLHPWTACALGIAALLLSAGAARAQAAGGLVPGTWSVTPSILGSGGGDLNSGGAGFSLAADYNTTPRTSLEADFTTLPSINQGNILPASSNLWTLTGNALYHFGTGRLLPYGVAGLGFGHGSVDLSPQLAALGAVDSSTNFVWDLGVGADWMMTDRISFRGDLRHFFGNDLTGSFNRISAGIGFHFGTR